MDRTNLINQAKTILTHPDFSKLPLFKIKEAFSYFLGKGLTKSDLENILNPPKRQEITYLESLSYPIFVNLILVGNITGKDLISFCNSSPLLKEKCDRAFNAEGKIIPEYIFYILLQKMGIKLKPGESPKARYIKALNNRESFLRLKAKFDVISSIKQKLNPDRFINPPSNLYEAFYSQNNPRGLFGVGVNYDGGNPDYDLSERLIRFLYYIRETTFRELSKQVSDKKQQKMIHELIYGPEISLVYYSTLLKKSPEELVNMVYPSYSGGHIFSSEGNMLEDLININNLYAKGLRSLFKYKYFGGLKPALSGSWETIIMYLTADMLDSIGFVHLTDSEIQTFNRIKTLDEQDINYVIYLHELILSGELPVLTPFTEKEMIRY